MIDLHTHSTFSDGTLTPEELVAKGVEAGLYAMALTDHDSTNGTPRFLAAATKSGIVPVSGVEISAKFSPGTMHILGYYVDHESPSLGEHLGWIRNGRASRNQEILHKLMELGCHITWEEVQSHAGEDVIGRPHFAQALIDKGCVKNFREAFDKYLAKGKPGYASRRRLTPKDSISLIRDAGGVAVLAHPFTLGLNKWEFRKELNALKAAGLQGMEIYYPEHSKEMQKEFSKLAKDYGLVATGGTDYHGQLTPDLKLGRGFGSLHISDEILEELQECRGA